MYDFHYGFIKKRFDVQSLFTNTDSLAYEIKSEDVKKNLLSTNIRLILVAIRMIQFFFTRLIKKLLVK